MALQSKTISAKGSRDHHTFILTVTEDRTNVSTNESILSFEFKLVDDYDWFWSSQGTYVSYKITIGSHTYEGYIPHHTTVTTKVRSEDDITEIHNSDGTKTINIGFTVTDSSSIYYLPGNASASSTMALTTIPRASGVSVGNVTISNTSGSLSATINPQASFWHRWKYVIGSYDSGWTDMSSAISSATSISVAYTTILSKITASSSGTVVFTVETHNSNDFNSASYIGTASATSTVTITLKPSAPTLTTLGFRSRSSGVNSNITTPTAGYTTVALTSWSNGTSSGATSYTTYFSVDQGASLKTTSATANNTVIETNTLPASAKQYTLTYTAYTVDSRGNKSANATKTVVVYGYSTPTLNLSAYRVASSSATTEDATGTYAYVTFSNTLRGQTDANGSLRSGNQNAIVSATCKYGSTTVTSGQHIALAVENTLTFTYTVQDRFTTTSTTRTVNSASFPLDLYDNGSGSVGVGLGGIARANCVSSPLNAYFGEKSSGNVEARVGSRDKTDGTAYLECYSKYGGMYIGASGSSSASDASWLTAIDQSNNYHNLINFRQNGRVYLNNIVFYHVITSAINADNFTEAGIYGIKFTIPSGYNFPTTNWGIMYVASSAVTGTMFQVYIPDSNNQNIYKRAYVNNAWTSWTKFNADYAETSNFSNYSYADRPKVFASNADLNNYTYMHGNWYSASSSLTNTVKNKPSGATSTLYLKNFPMSPGVPTEASTWYYDIQVLFDYEGEMWTRSVIGTGTANVYSYYTWQKREGNVTLWTGTLTGGNSQLINMTAVLRIRVFALTWGVQHVFEIDLDDAGKAQSGHGLTDSTWPWQGGSVVGHYDGAGTSGTFQHYSVSCKVGSDKKSLWVSGIGYANTNGAYQNRNGNSEYYVYRVDGII